MYNWNIREIRQKSKRTEMWKKRDGMDVGTRRQRWRPGPSFIGVADSLSLSIFLVLGYSWRVRIRRAVWDEVGLWTDCKTTGELEKKDRTTMREGKTETEKDSFRIEDLLGVEVTFLDPSAGQSNGRDKRSPLGGSEIRARHRPTAAMLILLSRDATFFYSALFFPIFRSHTDSNLLIFVDNLYKILRILRSLI